MYDILYTSQAPPQSLQSASWEAPAFYLPLVIN